MIDYFNPHNSIWPNGMKDDSDGHAVFYPLGTNKVDISTVTWPEGDKLISPFVYQNDELVGFVDTKAITVSGTATTTMNYNHIEADFASIFEGKLTVNTPNATVKKFKWGEPYDFVIIDFNTTDRKTIKAVCTAQRVVNNELYDAEGSLIGTIDTSKIKVGGIYDMENLRVNGLFCNMNILSGTERGLTLSEFDSDLSSLRDGSMMFTMCTNLESFTSDLPSLTNGSMMFAACSSLTTFNSDLSSLTNGDKMFNVCINLESFTSDLPSLTDGTEMFYDCTNLTSFSIDLPKLTNGYYMFRDCENLTIFSSNIPNLTNGRYMFRNCPNLASFSSDLPKLTDANYMFSGCDNLASFSSNMPSLTNVEHMFYGCSALTSFTSDLSNLTNGGYMFASCSALESFSSDLSSLTGGSSMFSYCSQLTSFSSDLPSLASGSYMFQACSNLTSFSSDLPSLTNAYGMFQACSNLTSFSSDLSSLTDGIQMFNNCTNLELFSSNLSSLMDGRSMFSNCKLDASSVKNIIDTINAYSGKLTLGMGCNNTETDKNLFAQEAGYADGMTSLLTALNNKGWTVTAQYNGRPTTTYGLRRPSEDTLPVFVKLEEVEETEDYADYTSEDGSKKYRLDWFHETTGSTEDYTQFNSLDEAIEALNIKPIERN